MEIAIQTEHGVYTVDVETEEVVDLDADAVLPGEPLLETGLPRVVAAAASGSTVVAVVDRRPPLAVSYDGGSTWHETGGGLPRGHAVAVSRDDPDLVVYAGRNRLFLSRDGGRFWSALAPELPAIQAIELAE